ncbi:MAG: branched-chain amino acid ABC transporter permease [Deltaproteobacteria bacterium]|nr:branched-chain amino acid ABC transporter permease [Deltaproteobacteria bacterium]
MKVLIIQLFVNGFITASFYALCGVSWGVIYRTTHIFHFSHHLVFAVAGYAAVMIASQAHLPYFLGLFAAVAAAALLGCGIDAFLYRPLRRMGATQATTFLASLGLGTAGVAILLLAFSSNPRRLEGFPAKVLSVGEAFFSVADLTLVIGCWVMIGLLLLFLAKSRYGKAIRAVGSNAEMARNVGLNIDRIYMLVFAIGSGLFGVAAFLFTAKNVAFPTMGILPFFMAFIAVFLGGVPSIPGHALAGFILGLSESLGMLVLPGEYKTMIAFAILFVVIVIRPEGLIGFKRG